MILDNIDFSKKYNFTLVLTKKNRKPISIISGLSGRSLDRTLDGIDKLSFDISYYVTDSHTQERIKNPNYDKVMEENMILLKCGDASEPIYEAYFIIKNITESSDKMSKRVECSSRQVMLNKNTVTLNGVERQLKKDEVNIGDGIFDILEQETSWKLGYMDESAKVESSPNINANKYRWFDALSKPWLSFLNDDVASAFNVLLTYDTVNKKINVLNRDNYGKHTGIILSEENYIKNLNKKISSENIVTKLEATGRDGLDFSEVNPYGTSHIFNYDYFRLNGQMSEELCSALDKYDVLVNAKNSEFQNLRSQIDTLNSDKITKQSEMAQLNEQLVALKLIQSGYLSSNDNINLSQATTNVNNKVIEIANKQAEINSVQSQINNINTQIVDISKAIDKKNAKDSQGNLIFDTDLLEELEDFTYTESWENSYYNDPTLLLNGAKEVLKDWSVPTIEFDMDLIDFFGYAKTQRYWDKINLGDFVRVFSSKFNTNVDVRIVGYTYNIDSNDLKITFSNKNKKLDDARGISNATKKSYEASKVVNVKKLEWNKIKDTKDAVDLFLNNNLDLTKQNVIAANGKNKIDITENGIWIINADDETQQIALLSGLIAITNDGWETCSTAIDYSGVYASAVVGKLLIGESLYIGDERGIITIQDGLITIKDDSSLPKTRVKLGNYDTNKFGLQLFNKNGDDVILSEDGIAQTNNVVFADNCDVDHPLRFKFYIDSETLSVRNARLSFTLEKYRATAKTTANGGNATITSEDGGSSQETTATKSFVQLSVMSGTPQNSVGTDNWGYHLHEVKVEGSYFTHYHDVTIPNHSHGVSIPLHNHQQVYGIVESTLPKDVRINIYKDGNVVYTGQDIYNTDQNNIELKDYIQSSGLYTIEMTTIQNGRINLNLFLKYFIAM